MDRRNIDLGKLFNCVNNDIVVDNNNDNSDDISNVSDDINPETGKKMTSKEKSFQQRDIRRRELNKIITLLNTKTKSKKVNEKTMFTAKKDFLVFLNKFYSPELEEFNY
jgi:hypothetical protein